MFIDGLDCKLIEPIDDRSRLNVGLGYDGGGFLGAPLAAYFPPLRVVHSSDVHRACLKTYCIGRDECTL